MHKLRLYSSAPLSTQSTQATDLLTEPIIIPTYSTNTYIPALNSNLINNKKRHRIRKQVFYHDVIFILQSIESPNIHTISSPCLIHTIAQNTTLEHIFANIPAYFVEKSIKNSTNTTTANTYNINYANAVMTILKGLYTSIQNEDVFTAVVVLDAQEGDDHQGGRPTVLLKSLTPYQHDTISPVSAFL